ncbi:MULTISPECIES: hypothetical protein [unclassified Streptomyces]|uniref:hypothetical protein n=1 Tax=unclassified Streptomyces TaxID=2593676 RepID=UPI0013A6C0E9|nr:MULTISPECIES: hypothetical protein [unclassified Streptomyces]
MRIYEEAAFQAWKAAEVEADRQRGVVVPLNELPGYVRGRALLEEAAQLIGDPTAPDGLARVKTTMRQALAVLPQSRPDNDCYTGRYRAGLNRLSANTPPGVCRVLTCGRCAPLREAERCEKANSSSVAAPRPPWWGPFPNLRVTGQ